MNDYHCIPQSFSFSLTADFFKDYSKKFLSDNYIILSKNIRLYKYANTFDMIDANILYCTTNINHPSDYILNHIFSGMLYHEFTSHPEGLRNLLWLYS